jgi:hypothetical protein
VETAAVPVSLVCQHSVDLTKRRIRDTASQTPVPQHPRHVQLFDDHRAMTAGKATRQFVQGVATNIGDAGVNSGDLAAALFTALATRLASGHCSLRPSEDTEVLTERSRILFNLRNKSWTSCHRQISYSNVDSDNGGLAVCGGNFALEFNGERDKPTVRSSRDGGGTDASSALFNTTSELSRGFVGSDLAESRQRNVVSVRLYPNCARGEAAGVGARPRFLKRGNPTLAPFRRPLELSQ